MKKNILFNLILLSFICLFSNSLFAETYSINGVVLDKDSKKPIAGATIRIIGTNKGTYASSQGKFRLAFLEGKYKIRVSSLGYISDTLSISDKKDTVFAYLKESPIMLKGGVVVGDIDVNQIIQRAIERKLDNLKKLKTFSGLLYSKLSLELGGALISKAEAGSNSISMSAGLGKKSNDVLNLFLMETFSRDYHDYEKKVSHSEIIQRHQTAYMKADQNLLVLGDFINFYDDEIDFISTKMITPIGKDAFSRYNYKLLDRIQEDDRYIYIIQVIPNSNTYPAFVGTIKIVEGTYNLVELNLQPSQKTAITFVDSLSFQQKFIEAEKDIWCPSYFEVKCKVRVDAIKGLFDIKADMTATSIYNEIQVNKPLPDSIYIDTIPKITVAKLADSTKTEFWEKNSMREISDRELEAYKKVDSLVKADSNRFNGNPSVNKDFNMSLFTPYIDFNRVGSVSLGLTPSITDFGFELGGYGGYSFGLKKPVGEIGLTYDFSIKSMKYKIFGRTFSGLESFSTDNSFNKFVNTITSALFQKDYYDWFKKDGWNAGFGISMSNIELNAYYEEARHFSMIKNTNRYLFGNSYWEENRSIINDNHKSICINFKTKSNNPLETFLGIENHFDINYIRILDKDKNNPSLIEGKLFVSIPTFGTGYNPMILDLAIHGGTSNGEMPAENQFKMNTDLSIIGSFGNFYTAQSSIYGGTSFFAVHGRYNTTDLWWRFLGIPTYEGRGLDLLLYGSYGRFFSNDSNLVYKTTGNDYYGEVGFGFSRIPTFVSNVVYLGVDFHWGIGPIAKRAFSWDLSVTLPF